MKRRVTLRMRKWLIGVGIALGVLLFALFFPEPEADAVTPAGYERFTWPDDDMFSRLETRYDDAVRAGCEARTPALEAGLRGLDTTLDQIERQEPPAGAAIWGTLEGQVFEVAPLFGACPERVPELLTRSTRVRALAKSKSVAWDMNDRVARDTLYRLLYGTRAAIEELLLQMRDNDAPGLIMGTDVPSATPSVTFRGVTLHSGDILVSRGGAPTSALIARGNDYPGNFSHIALLHVSEASEATLLEAHIESGAQTTTPERYFEDTKLRIMVLRLRADHPALVDAPDLPHRAASAQMAEVNARHIPYDFEMNHLDPSEQFCSEVASSAYRAQDVELWRGLSSFSSEGLTRWLASVGVRYFETHAPSDIEYDPQLSVVAEWRSPETLFRDHVDNAIIDALLEGAEEGDVLDYDYAMLPVARVAKGYSLLLNLFGGVGPVPEGMSATTGLRVGYLDERHAAVRAALEPRIEAYREEHDRRPPYWTLVRLAQEAKSEVDRAD